MNISSFLSSRYLIPSDKIPREKTSCDLLVLGGGIAGMAASICAAEAGVRVVLVTKDSLEESNSFYAQGGIAAVLDASDSIDLHIQDTIDAGQGLADEEIVRLVVTQGPAAIKKLISWGSEFDRVNGTLSLSKEGGHSAPRVVHSRDMTGMEIQRAMIKKVKSYRNVRIMPLHFAIDLLHAQNRCAGALLWNREEGFKQIASHCTILVTGGAGQVYRETTNPTIATGDGIAMAYRAGANIRDMEFFQFHPTILYLAGSSRLLISETARGEGGILRDRHGYRFMPDYHEKAELAPRDVVSRAIQSQMAKTQFTHVFLDMTHKKASFIKERFPNIYKVCSSYDIDITREYIPVRPAAHYCIGGVQIDLDGRTSLPDLFAAGEVSSSRLHGANRLGSNSLLEGVVFGWRAAKNAVASLPRSSKSPGSFIPDKSEQAPAQMKPDVVDFKNSIKALMWRCVGISRSHDDLLEACESLDLWSRLVFRIHFERPGGWELCNMLTVARLIAAGALHRQESRGVHYRNDFNERDDLRWKQSLTWCVNDSSKGEESN
ncbi:MAG: L-aspartate oxidase [Planctomycetes bacterium]|nr:L-aspartate oxidase [Planctomycetota bacterium]